MTASTRWILAIVGLLVGNVLAMVILATTATTRGPEIIPAYYAQAAAFDDKIDEATQSHRLGWVAEAALSSSTVEVSVRDAAGAPLAGARVHVAGYQRAYASQRLDSSSPTSAAAATARRSPPSTRAVHDLTIVVERAGQRYVDAG